MKPFKVAAGLLVIYCFMHTAGGMLSQESLGPDSDRVFEQMKLVHFDFNGSASSWYGFWFGFGLMFSAFLVMSAFVAWKLDGVSRESWPEVSFVAWALVATHAVCTVLAFRYFFAGPGTFGVLISALLALGAVRKSRATGSGAPLSATPA
ncbi:MAG TPA: hypothetical protein VGD87_16405 [Archangium sp.]